MTTIILGTVVLIGALLVKNGKLDWLFFTFANYAEKNDLIPLRRLLWRLYLSISFILFALAISSFIEFIPNNITFMIGRISIVGLGIIFAIKASIISKELKKKS
jgi:hypothetical protein